MKQTARIISTYSADNFGVCSALYELGGLIVMHDPSGCNSTYTTHDEPRWYSRDSLIYISALTEQDAVLGRDQRLTEEICDIALTHKPRFICVIPSQIAFLIGTDLKAICRLIEQRTGIPSFPLPTNSMHYYEQGIYYGLEELAKRVIQHTGQAVSHNPPSPQLRLNLLGVTPLDFGPDGWLPAWKIWLRQNNFHLQSCWAMNSSLDEILRSGSADVNLVASYGGLGAARLLWRELGQPYVCGLPLGPLAPILAQAIQKAGETKQPLLPYAEQTSCIPANAPKQFIIGETILAESLAAALELSGAGHFRAIIPLETDNELLRSDSLRLTDECELEPVLKDAKTIIADPLYQAICPASTHFLRLPHMGFSGRLYQKELRNLIQNFPALLRELSAPINHLPSHGKNLPA